MMIPSCCKAWTVFLCFTARRLYNIVSHIMPNKMDFEQWKFLASSAVFGALAGAVRALRNGLAIRPVALQAVTAFVLCMAGGSLLSQYTTTSIHVIFGACGLIGLSSDQVLRGVDRLWSASFDKAESSISGDGENGDHNEPGASDSEG